MKSTHSSSSKRTLYSLFQLWALSSHNKLPCLNTSVSCESVGSPYQHICYLGQRFKCQLEYLWVKLSLVLHAPQASCPFVNQILHFCVSWILEFKVGTMEGSCIAVSSEYKTFPWPEALGTLEITHFTNLGKLKLARLMMAPLRLHRSR